MALSSSATKVNTYGLVPSMAHPDRSCGRGASNVAEKTSFREIIRNIHGTSYPKVGQVHADSFAEEQFNLITEKVTEHEVATRGLLCGQAKDAIEACHAHYKDIKLNTKVYSARCTNKSYKMKKRPVDNPLTI